MKAIVLKKMMPAAVFMLGISGAFFTMSMQSTAEDVVPIIGFVPSEDDPCDIPVSCDTAQGQLCRLFGATGPQAKAMDSPTTCNRVVFRPQ
ncbi:DUF6520 family protein [Flavobacterium sp. YO12]|uniref:DUF6520 family protein n=1 Tax=Flavobacterium sp. YO12 TaxID=1920029 RepID=UPI00100C0133|nr:DUF6520 family protein [Flavobacterium sp. YO12]RXM48050.1 hypothetical protein BOW55_07650 [Flavobacterium sp. YO12]